MADTRALVPTLLTLRSLQHGSLWWNLFRVLKKFLILGNLLEEITKEFLPSSPYPTGRTIQAFVCIVTLPTRNFLE